MTLIEVLVASFVLGTGILCLLALQTTALGIGVSSAHRQQASLMLLELSEIAYISPGALKAIDPAPLITGSAQVSQNCRSGAACSVTNFVSHELSIWVNNVHNRLPEAQIDIRSESQGGQLIWVVKLSWYGPQGLLQNSLQAELWL